MAELLNGSHMGRALIAPLKRNVRNSAAAPADQALSDSLELSRVEMARDFPNKMASDRLAAATSRAPANRIRSKRDSARGPGSQAGIVIDAEQPGSHRSSALWHA